VTTEWGIAAMTEVSLLRLYLLRAMYLLIVVGLAATIWPLLISHDSDWPLMNGVVAAMLGAVSLLAALGLRHPLQMLPVLLFELAWKAIWLTAVALPLWSAGEMDARTLETVKDCATAILIPIVLPWRYLVDHYVKQPADRWKSREAGR
jgi:hypothetical protein